MATAHVVSSKLAADAEAVYQRLRPQLETPEKIGKMIIIEPESGDFEIDDLGVRAARRLRERRPQGDFFGIRIGYKFAESFGGGLIRRDP